MKILNHCARCYVQYNVRPSNQCQHTFPPECQHIMQESGRSASNTTASLVLYRRTLPNDHTQVLRAEQLLSLVWNFCEAAHTSKMERIQYRALKCIYNYVSTSYEELLARANLPNWELHRKREILVEVFKSVNNISRYFMLDLFKVKDVNYNLQNNRNVCLNHCQTKKYGLDFLHHGAQANYGTATK